jgi:cell wall assembly regulator SMI1
MDQVLGQVLRNAVWERLDMLTDLANRADAQSLVSVARSELPRLTEAWRAMLKMHEPDERGDCPTCSTRWHRCKAPCSVWQVAHEHLVAGGLAPQQAPADRRLQGRRKSPVPAQAHPAPAPTAAETTGRHALVNPRRAVTA